MGWCIWQKGYFCQCKDNANAKLYIRTRTRQPRVWLCTEKALELGCITAEQAAKHNADILASNTVHPGPGPLHCKINQVEDHVAEPSDPDL